MTNSGAIVWTDLTVKNAEKIRDFYAEVVGWSSERFEGDFTMVQPGSRLPVAGICHASGINANLPAQWLVYIAVDDLDRSIEACRRAGGKVVHGPRAAGSGRICVIQDPAGAVAALYQVPSEAPRLR